MSKTPFSKKCEVLGEFFALYRYSDDLSQEWSDFMVTQDIGLPAAFMVWQDIATIKKGSQYYVDETWDIFCLMLGVDPDSKWNTMQDMFLASENNVASEG